MCRRSHRDHFLPSGGHCTQPSTRHYNPRCCQSIFLEHKSHLVTQGLGQLVLERRTWAKFCSVAHRYLSRSRVKARGLEQESIPLRKQMVTSASLDLNKYLFIYLLFLATLGLHCCSGFFSSCGKWGLLSNCGTWAFHCGGFSCCRAQALGCIGFSSCGTRAQQLRLPGSTTPAEKLCHMDLVVLRHVGSSRTRDQTRRSPCIGRQILYHWTTREAPSLHF